MSLNHHGESPNPDTESMKRFLAQVEGRAKRNYPEGRIAAEDDGELAFAIAADRERKLVILDFGKKVDWVGMPPEQAIQLAQLLINKAREVSSVAVILDLATMREKQGVKS